MIFEPIHIIDNIISIINTTMKRPYKVYYQDSNVKEFGKGLFAKEQIKKGSIVAEFKGKLLRPGEDPSNSRSNVYFNDEYILECPSNDLASFANDAINFTKQRRHLMESLLSDKPFYTKHPNTKVNAHIKTNSTTHRAFLIADCDIQINEEIFCHYGFSYWYKTEITKIGFLQEDEIDENGFPDDIYNYPAFFAYIKEFYPDYKNHEVKPFKDKYDDVIVDFNDGSHIVIMLERFSSKISSIDKEELQKLTSDGYF